ncbi:MAG: MATE family efflux transporter [Oscillospiraceae bacterium]
MIDQIFIGNSSIGTIGITATSVVFPMITIAMAFGLMLGDGATAYLSLCMGKRESDKIGKAIGSAITIAAGIGVIFWIAGYSALDRILNFLGAKTAESMATSHEYAFWILLGLPFTILGTSLTPIVRADGAPKVAMASGLSGCLQYRSDRFSSSPMHIDAWRDQNDDRQYRLVPDRKPASVPHEVVPAESL